jgi:hypothetical protein
MIRLVAPLAALLLAAAIPMPTSAAEASLSAASGNQLVQTEQVAEARRRRVRRVRRSARRARRPRQQQSQSLIARPAEIG